jgi:membrane associated rhomboid family serine protease
VQPCRLLRIVDSRPPRPYLQPMPGFLQRPLRYSFYNATIVLIAANLLVFILTWLSPRAAFALALIPAAVLQEGMWWQIVTYMFVHSGFQHIFFNMLALFLFGIQLERRLGSTEFLLYYFFTGIGAGLATLLINSAAGLGGVAVVGASGAIFGLLLAFASFFPDARIFIFGFFPIRAPTAVLLYAGIEIVMQFWNVRSGSRSGVAHLTHLAGLAFGFLYLLVRFRINPIRVFFRRR